MMGETPSIQVEDLHKRFGHIQALDGVTLAVGGNQIFGLLGPNGAGKTTLIRLLIGSTRPTSGQVKVLALDPIKQKAAVRSRIGYMPQEPALYEDLSARANLHFFGRAHQVPELTRRVDEVLDFVGLISRADDPIYKFSGGMRQRVSLACALVHQPKLLFLDEPTSGIDPQLRDTFWRHFRQLTAEGVTLVVSTHQMDEAMHCDRLAILHRGALLAEDAPRRLLRNGRATLKIQRGDEHIEVEAHDYPQELPRLLHQYGLDPAVQRIDIEEETLESTVLRMIQEYESGAPEVV